MQMQYYKTSYELFQKLQPQIEALGKEVEKLGASTINIQMDGVLLKKRKGKPRSKQINNKDTYITHTHTYTYARIHTHNTGLTKNWVRYLCSIMDGFLVYKPESPKKKDDTPKKISIVLCSIRKLDEEKGIIIFFCYLFIYCVFFLNRQIHF
jgi:hypothetical protein